MADIKVIKNRISRGKKYWEKENKDKFERFRRFLQIRHYPDGEQSADQITVPYIHALLRAKLPFLYYRHPEVIVTPKRKITKEAIEKTLANIDSVRSTMEYLPDEIGMEAEVKKVVTDKVAFGKGVLGIGFEYEIEEPGKKSIVNKVIDKVTDFATGKETPTQEEVKILVDRFYVKRVAYPRGFFIYDPESTDGLKDSRWCAEKIIEPLDDVKKNKKFKNTKDLKSNCTVDKDLTIEQNKEDGDELRLEYYRYFEKNRFGVVNVCKYVVPDQNVELAEYSGKDYPYAHGDFPYEELDGYAVPDSLFPIGDIEPMETQQRELDLMESIQTMHARSFVQKYVYVKGKLTPSQIARLTDPTENLCDIGEDSGLRALENPTVNQTVPMTTDMIKGDMTKISGVSEYDTAVIPKTETTLGEAQMVQGGANNRKEDDKKSVEDFVGRVMNKLFATVQQYMTDDMIIKITGDGSKPDDWANISPENIQGEFDFKIQPNSASPVNKDKLRADNLALYDKFSKDPIIPIAGKNQLRKWVLESFDKKDVALFDTVIEEDPSAVSTAGEIPTDMNGRPIDAERVPMDENGRMMPNTEPVQMDEAGQPVITQQEMIDPRIAAIMANEKPSEKPAGKKKGK
jgi:hypothetical protein